LKNAKVQSLPISWLKIEGNEFAGFGQELHENTKQRKILRPFGHETVAFCGIKTKSAYVIGKESLD
jgi:hypothetical protein